MEALQNEVILREIFKHLPYITALDFPQLFPNLRKVRIREDNLQIHYDTDIRYYEDENGMMIPYNENDGPVIPYGDINGDMIPQVIQAAPNASETTLEIVVEDNIRNSKLLDLRKLFPNVISFAIQGRCDISFPPLGLLGKLWPNLESLRVTIDEWYGNKLNAEVFGLHYKEVDHLRCQDIEFLNSVQIIPCRPCVGTMTNLNEFLVEFLGKKFRKVPGKRTSFELIQGLVAGRKIDLSFRMKHVNFASSWSGPRFRDLWENVYPYHRWYCELVEDTTTDEESCGSEDSTGSSNSSSYCDDDESYEFKWSE